MEKLAASVSVVDGDRWEVFPKGGLGSSRVYYSPPLPPELLNTIERDARVHQHMLEYSSSGAVSRPYPQGYFRFSKDRSSSLSSSQSNSVTTAVFYKNIEDKLTELIEGPSQEGNFEAGAAETAKTLLHALQIADYPPPELSWHGGDAVVMLWALQHATYAITITDGEIGYVFRNNKKTVKRKDSISVTNFKLAQLTHYGI